MEEKTKTGELRELRVGIHQLSSIFMDRLEQGSRHGSLDQAQMRMLGSLALRSFRLWKEILALRTSEDETEPDVRSELAGKMQRLEKRIEP